VVTLSQTGFKKKNPKVDSKKKTTENTKEEHKNTELYISKYSVIHTNKKVDSKSRWNIIELAEDITFEEHSDVIERHIPNMFGADIEYFVPFYKQKINEKIVSLILFEGYFFVRSTESVLIYPDKFHDEYIKGPMKKNRMVVEIFGTKINELKEELKLKLKQSYPKRKQIVIPKIGTFSNLEGEVVSVDKKNLVAIVRFKYSTRIVDAPISFINLTIMN
jgi:hypothetical protein